MSLLFLLPLLLPLFSTNFYLWVRSSSSSSRLGSALSATLAALLAGDFVTVLGTTNDDWPLGFAGFFSAGRLLIWRLGVVVWEWTVPLMRLDESEVIVWFRFGWFAAWPVGLLDPWPDGFIGCWAAFFGTCGLATGYGCAFAGCCAAEALFELVEGPDYFHDARLCGAFAGSALRFFCVFGVASFFI